MAKNVLLIGAGSFIGRCFLSAAQDTLTVTARPGRSTVWRETDFAGYDALLLCAGLVHIKQTPRNRGQFHAVNCRMAVDIARKAREAGVGQFVFLSTMSVYGRHKGVILPQTQPKPKDGDAYGLSKWQAEQELGGLAAPGFTLTILRPPMVYGRGCPGNFPRLASLCRRLPLFPDIANQRSMLYAPDLARLLAALIQEGRGGVFCPQNKDPVCTTELARLMAHAQGRTLRTTKLFNPAVRLAARFCPPVSKLFDSYVYHPDLSVIEGIDYQLTDFPSSVMDSIEL